MYKRVMTIFSDPKPGRADEFNGWYTHDLIYSILAIPGVRSAQRFIRIDQPDGAAALMRQRYFAIYEYDIETADLAAAIRERQKDGRIRVGAALDYEGVDALFLDLVPGAPQPTEPIQPAMVLLARPPSANTARLNAGDMHGPFAFARSEVQIRATPGTISLWLDTRVALDDGAGLVEAVKPAGVKYCIYRALTPRVTGPLYQVPREPDPDPK